MRPPARLKDPLDRGLWVALHSCHGPYDMRAYWRERREDGVADAELARDVDAALSNLLGRGCGGMTRAAAWLSGPPRLWVGGLPRWGLILATGLRGLARHLGRPPDLEGAALVARARTILKIPYPKEGECPPA